MRRSRHSTWHAPARRWTEDDGRQAVDAWQRSGLGAHTFAREHGFSAQRLYWWRDRLRSTALVSLVPAEIVGGSEERGGNVECGRVVVRIGEVAIEANDAPAAWVAALVGKLARPT